MAMAIGVVSGYLYPQIVHFWNEPTPRAKARGFREQKTDIPPLCSGWPFIPEFETSGFSDRFYKALDFYIYP
jgi:hypothetical protein